MRTGTGASMGNNDICELIEYSIWDYFDYVTLHEGFLKDVLEWLEDTTSDGHWYRCVDG